jgi:hypothetical protein
MNKAIVIVFVTARVETNILGLTYKEYGDAEPETVVRAHPRRPGSRRKSSKHSTME